MTVVLNVVVSKYVVTDEAEFFCFTNLKKKIIFVSAFVTEMCPLVYLLDVLIFLLVL